MSEKKSTEKETLDLDKELLVLGHLIKYNLYLLSKSIVFSSLLSKHQNSLDAVRETNDIMNELDLDTKKKLQEQN